MLHGMACAWASLKTLQFSCLTACATCAATHSLAVLRAGSWDRRGRTACTVRAHLLHALATDVPCSGDAIALAYNLVDLINVHNTPLSHLHAVHTQHQPQCRLQVSSVLSCQLGTNMWNKHLRLLGLASHRLQCKHGTQVCTLDSVTCELWHPAPWCRRRQP